MSPGSGRKRTGWFFGDRFNTMRRRPDLAALRKPVPAPPPIIHFVFQNNTIYFFITVYLLLSHFSPTISLPIGGQSWLALPP
ncbi:hypothetical protein P3W85_22450 [Cupriavidus basilensis]|uniref:Transmembrane protein n=1 Tax=Cupriavidus basilensis TaxID=68895 RepID=A0ABT6AST5_9BURK|nr:hypothetical protein [Cupriavidus basilensis]